MKYTSKIITLMLFSAGFSSAASVIAYNFTNNWPNTTLQGKGTADGTDLWTDSVDTSTGQGTSAPNSTDANAITIPVGSPGVSVAWSSSNLYQAGTEANLEEGLYRMYLDDAGTGPQVTISGLSAWLTAEGATAYRIDIYRNSRAPMQHPTTLLKLIFTTEQEQVAHFYQRLRLSKLARHHGSNNRH